MAVELKRKCGYRKIGGLYLVSPGGGIPCDRLPFPLTVCPTCSCGIKQSRGWTWIDVGKLFGGSHSDCTDNNFCPLCINPQELGKAGLLWVGEKFYKSAEEFSYEADVMGISRRIAAIPRGFELGKTWVLLAHPKAVYGLTPGIFRIFKPTAIEKIVTKTQASNAEEMKKLTERGITPVIVPDEDVDHQETLFKEVE